MLTLKIDNAVPEDTIRFRLDPSMEVGFRPGPFIGRTFADRSEKGPVIEFLSVDRDEVNVVLSPSSRRHNPGAVDFELTVAIEGDPDTATFALTADAFEGTEISASMPGLSARRLPLGAATVLPYTLRGSELVSA